MFINLFLLVNYRTLNYFCTLYILSSLEIFSVTNYLYHHLYLEYFFCIFFKITHDWFLCYRLYMDEAPHRFAWLTASTFWENRKTAQKIASKLQTSDTPHKESMNCLINRTWIALGECGGTNSKVITSNPIPIRSFMTSTETTQTPAIQHHYHYKKQQTLSVKNSRFKKYSA